jgi:hypothetical protein
LDWNSPCADTSLDSIRIRHPNIDFIDLWYHAPRYDFYNIPRPQPATTSPDLGAIESIYPNAIQQIPENMNYLSIYPNPATDKVIVRSNDGTNILRVEIFDISGRLVKTTSGIRSTEASIPIGNLVEGVYFLRVNSKRMYSGKIIIQ